MARLITKSSSSSAGMGALVLSPRRTEEGPSFWKGCSLQPVCRPLRSVLGHLRRRSRGLARALGEPAQGLGGEESGGAAL